MTGLFAKMKLSPNRWLKNNFPERSYRRLTVDLISARFGDRSYEKCGSCFAMLINLQVVVVS